MGHTPFELSRSAEASLLAAMSTSQPLVLKSSLSRVDAAALVDEWELHVAQDPTPYQMANGKGTQTLASMWVSPLRLEHDLEDTDVINPVVAWLQNAPPEDGILAQAWRLQQTIDVGGTDAPGGGGGGHPWGLTSPSPPGALGWVVNPHPLGSAARGGVGMPSGECPTP